MSGRFILLILATALASLLFIWMVQSSETQFSGFISGAVALFLAVLAVREWKANNSHPH